uniref:Uncharacterized protein n=1 Tax=Romanomermis culicivorax TaxID=13658 RepID=A0A915KZM3_ROMCU
MGKRSERRSSLASQSQPSSCSRASLKSLVNSAVSRGDPALDSKHSSGISDLSRSRQHDAKRNCLWPPKRYDRLHQLHQSVLECAFPLIALLNNAENGQLINDFSIKAVHHSLRHLSLVLQDLSYEKRYLVTKCLGSEPTLLPDIRSSVVPGNEPIACIMDTASKLVPPPLFGSALLKDLKDLFQGDKSLRDAVRLLNDRLLAPTELGIKFDENLIFRFMKDVTSEIPPKSRHISTWDLAQVLSYLDSLHLHEKSNFKSLTFKTKSKVVAKCIKPVVNVRSISLDVRGYLRFDLVYVALDPTSHTFLVVTKHICLDQKIYSFSCQHCIHPTDATPGGFIKDN